MSFFSISPADMQAMREDFGLDSSARAKDTQERWFLPEEGFSTAKALLVRTTSLSPKLREGVERDLRNLVSDLEAARTRGVRWHLSVDY
jgi:hypothetical protein